MYVIDENNFIFFVQFVGEQIQKFKALFEEAANFEINDKK